MIIADHTVLTICIVVPIVILFCVVAFLADKFGKNDGGGGAPWGY